MRHDYNATLDKALGEKQLAELWMSLNMYTVYVHTPPDTVLQKAWLFSGREIGDRYVGTLWRAAERHLKANKPAVTYEVCCRSRVPLVSLSQRSQKVSHSAESTIFSSD